MSKISIIIPSVGRVSLIKSLESLISQKDPDWVCHVGFDGLTKQQVHPSLRIDDPRIHYHFIEKKLGKMNRRMHNFGGLVRNQLIDRVTTDWIGFLDDDDTLHQNYTTVLNYHIKTSDVLDFLVYRMIYKDGKLIPSIKTTQVEELVGGNIGINFAAKTKFIKDNNIRFKNGPREDFNFLADIRRHGGIGKISEEVLYKVGH